MSWTDYMAPGEVSRSVASEMEGVVERVLAAGAVPPLEYAGAGGQGIVLCDSTGRAFKAARAFNDFGRRGLRAELDWFSAAAAHPEASKYVPEVHGLDEDHAVLVRECVRGDRPGWRDDYMAWEGELRSVPGWRPPESGRDQWIMSGGGPKIVDAGFAIRRGMDNAAYVANMLQGKIPWYGEDPKDLAWGLAIDYQDGLVSAEVVRPLVRALRAMRPGEDWSSAAVKSLLNPPAGPRSKLCREGRHDFDRHTGACARRGCSATLTATMFPMTPEEERQAYGYVASLEADRLGPEQRTLF